MAARGKEQNKIIISGNRIYEEVILTGEFSDELVIGTTKASRIRFERSEFFCDFEIRFYNEKNGDWSVSCNRDIYIDSGSIARKYSGIISRGMEMLFRYTNGDAILFSISLQMDFDSVPCDYLRKINLRNVNNLCLGGTDFSRIFLDGEMAEGDYLTMTQQGNSYIINVNQVKNGIFINGIEVKEKVIALKNRDFLTFDGYKFYLQDLYLYTDSEDRSIISKVGEEIIRTSNNSFKYPKFIKNVRLKNVISDEKIDVLPPDNKKEMEKENLFITILPSLLMLIISVGLRSKMNTNPMFAVYIAVMMGMGIVTSIYTHIRQKKKNSRDEEKRIKNYTEYMKKKEKYIQDEREKERLKRQEIFIDPEIELKEVKDFDNHLFEKTKEDEDFLTVRLGEGEIKASRNLNIKEKECIASDDPLMDYPDLLKDSYEIIKEVPVTLDLKKYGVVGVRGNEADLYSLIKILTLDIVTRHFFDDVKLYYKFKKEEIEKFRYLRWLKNLYNSDKYTIRNLIYDKDSQKIHFEELYKELSFRNELKEADINSLPYYVIMISDSEGFASHPVSNFVDKAEKLHVVFIFFERYIEKIPKETRVVIDLDDGVICETQAVEGQSVTGKVRKEPVSEEKIPVKDKKKKSEIRCGRVIIASDKKDVQAFTYKDVSDSDMEYVARKLACVYVDSVNLESNLTSNISLYKLLGIISDTDLDLKSRWAASKVYESMAAPLGVKAGDSIVYLDLNEKAHGPHGLVAGTTGSGKSEILQSYILSMATLFSPADVSFVIIDFKGGGMANQFRELPHLIGSITNIDGEAIDRSLASIKAELRKRQEYFRQYDVNHIDAYIKLYKQGVAKNPLPHLILIVDEFAELKSDQPEFMQELISTARIGRSLGVHLILATQKPAGVVNDQIWSNSKFKLCLKVQNASDSNEVLHSPLAAEIREAGRAYLQVGNNEIFELFQSVYSGAFVDCEKSGQKHEYDIKELDLLGRGKVVFEQKNEKNKNKETQLQALVKYIADYCKKEEIVEIPGICLPELPANISKDQAEKLAYIRTDRSEQNTGDKEAEMALGGTKDNVNESEIMADIGIYDDPDKQEQGHYMLNISKGHTLIIGSPQTGKTNILQQIVKDLMRKGKPDEVNIYILDFSSGVLKNYDGSNIVGGVVTATDDDKFMHFILLMQNEIIRRKELLTESGLSSFAAYKEAGNKDLPQIVVMIDYFLGVKESYLQKEDMILPLMREGISLGISFIVTDIQATTLGFRYMSLFTNKIVLFCNNGSDYQTVFGMCRKKLKDIPGRSIIEMDKKHFFMQNYLSFEGEKEIDRIARMKEEIAVCNEKTAGRHAVRIPEVPIEFTDEMLLDMEKSGLKKKKYSPVFGIEFSSASPERLDLTRGIMGVIGGDETIRNMWISNLILQLIRDDESEFKAVIFDDYKKSYSKNLKKLAAEKGADSYNNQTEMIGDKVEIKQEPEEISACIDELYEDALKTKGLLKENPDNLEQIPLKLLIINNKEAMDMINKDRKLLEKYKELIGKYHSLKIMIIISCIDDVKQGYTNVDVQKSVIESQNIMFLDSINQIRIIEIQPSTRREFPKPLTKTEGLLFKDGEFKKYKLLV